GRGGDRNELDLELVELEFLLYGIDDPVADVDCKADRLRIVVQIGKRNRRVAVAYGDRARFLDVLQRPRQFLGSRLSRAERGSERQANHAQVFHWCPPRW